MNEIIVKDEVKIEDLIYEVRGVQVMFDSDLAKLYECKNGTKSINLAVLFSIEPIFVKQILSGFKSR